MSPTLHPIDISTNHGAVPIRCFTSEKLLPDQRATDQLMRLAAVRGLANYVAVLPDVHFKSRNPTPTGTVVVTRDVIVPRAIDAGINCGMSMLATPLEARDLTAAVLDELFHRLIEAIPLKEHRAPVLAPCELEQVLAHGAEKLCGPLELGPEELTRVENGGRTMPELSPDDVLCAVPQNAIRKGACSVGTIGAGNHFLELQAVTEILDDRVARLLGLAQGRVIFMLHSDSRRLGKKIMRPLWERLEHASREGTLSHELWTLPTDSEFGRRYLCGVAAATHAGFANRAAVTEILRRTLRKVLGDDSLALRLIYDCGHETIQRESQNGDSFWVHRHGASRAFPASCFTADPVLGETGQPVPIPGSMGADSFIAVARPGAAQTFYSVAHGAGRLIDKQHAAARFEEAQIEADVRASGVRLYRYGSDNIAGQAPASFKDAAAVVAAMSAFDLIQPVARLRPIAVLKG